MKKFNFKKQKGFSLVEILVSIGITMAIFASSMTFLHYFSKVSNRNIIKNNMLEELRVTIDRLEKEMLPANKVLYSDSITTGNTGKDKLILEAPIVSSLGFYVTDSTGVPAKDKMVIYTENDGSSLNLRTPPVLHNRIKFTVQRSLFSNRTTNLADQILTSLLMPVDTGSKEYILPSTITPENIGVFSYFNASGTDISGSISSQADCDTIASVRVTLWAEKEYSNYSLTEKKTMDITIRNFEGS